MQKLQTLAEFLGTSPAPAGEQRPRLEDIAGDAKAFCEAVLNSYEFRQYIINGLVLGSVPAAVMLRLMDMAGWQKPPDRVEHTGKDGEPVEVITRIVRVVVDPRAREEEKAVDTIIVH